MPSQDRVSASSVERLFTTISSTHTVSPQLESRLPESFSRSPRERNQSIFPVMPKQPLGPLISPQPPRCFGGSLSPRHPDPLQECSHFLCGGLTTCLAVSTHTHVHTDRHAHPRTLTRTSTLAATHVQLCAPFLEYSANHSPEDPAALKRRSSFFPCVAESVRVLMVVCRCHFRNNQHSPHQPLHSQGDFG